MIKEQEVLAPPHALQPRVSVSGREVPITSGCKKKKQGLRLRKMKTSGFPVSSSSRIHAWTHSDSLSLTSRARSAACKASETHGEELNCLASGWELEGQLSPTQMCWQRHLFLWWALLPQSWQESAISETLAPGSHSVPQWWFPQIPPHQTFGPCQAVFSGFPYKRLVSCFRFSWTLSNNLYQGTQYHLLSSKSLGSQNGLI